MVRSLIFVLRLGFVLFPAGMAGASPAPCGSGKPAALQMGDAAVDPNAFVFVGKVARVDVAPPHGPEARTGTIEIDVERVLRGEAAKRVTVPVFAEYCLPKAACLPSMIDITPVGAKIAISCVVPNQSAPRIAIVPADAPALADLKRCVAIDASKDRSAALASAYVEGKQLARSCVANTVCDDARRADGVAAVAAMIASPKLDADAKLDLADVLTQPIALAQSVLGCSTPPHLFRASAGGDDANALIVKTLLESMLADRDVDHRRRWAGAMWGMIIEWRDHADAPQKAFAKLDGGLARRASKMLRSLGGDDAPNFVAIAEVLDATHRR